jgi:hypothetical protein
VCHDEKYETYIRHGHALKLYHTGGKDPVNDLDLVYPWGQTLPPLPPNVTWLDVEYIMRGSSGTGSFRYVGGNRGTRQFNGYYIDAATGNAGSKYSCGKCHTTGYKDYDPNDADPVHHQLGLMGIRGVWALEGIQCESCHGAGGMMAVPTVKECDTCHTGDDTLNGVLTRRMQFDKAGKLYGGNYGWLSANHSQADEFLHSPHKNLTCSLCHDPHKSVWHDDGGVRYSEVAGVGHMCTHCHDKQVRGGMGDLGLECVDCHMPEASMKGSGASHLFRITTTNLAAKDNTHRDSDSGTKDWWNVDGNGDAFLTLDLVCTKCHNNMTLDQMAKFSKTIHREPNLIDLTVNGRDTLQTVKKTDVVSVDFSVDSSMVEGSKGKAADWWVLRQTTKGWSYWNGKAWKSGMRAWRKNVAIADVDKQNVFRSKLTPGQYTFWVEILPSDGSEEYADSVPVYVTKR